MTKNEEQKIFNDYEDLLVKEAKENEERNNKELKKLRNLISKYKYKEIIEFLEDCGEIFDIKIVNSGRFGEKQEENYWFKYIYLTQDCGYTGDDYSGTIFIPLFKKNNRYTYLKFEYHC